ncbi:MAG: NADH-quinone oxidoreductase subunit C [Ignavibacteriales bacterium]|nr:NADH-quinone oxidoreductase subunit C [Ignavibacteriales bacterium]MCF8306463.1 NADH-quinone oxidoreductase subunit C [Ignavibacteriales bacterium]MCF8435681.1 NADH-quinone oxidoreductase subunit C [Ignavibacteriales bacterium]
MKSSKEIFEILKDEFGDKILELKEDIPVDPYIIVTPDSTEKIARFLHDSSDLQFDSLMVLSGVDDNNPVKTKNEDGTESLSGGTLSVYYHLYSIPLNHKIVIRAVTEKENPMVQSVESVWKTADWHEREAFDMVGIRFENHPDLTRILLPYDWDESSFPLRKDYKNPEFYQGMKIPY